MNINEKPHKSPSSLWLWATDINLFYWFFMWSRCLLVICSFELILTTFWFWVLIWIWVWFYEQIFAAHLSYQLRSSCAGHSSASDCDWDGCLSIHSCLSLRSLSLCTCECDKMVNAVKKMSTQSFESFSFTQKVVARYTCNRFCLLNKLSVQIRIHLCAIASGPSHHKRIQLMALKQGFKVS